MFPKVPHGESLRLLCFQLRLHTQGRAPAESPAPTADLSPLTSGPHCKSKEVFALLCYPVSFAIAFCAGELARVYRCEIPIRSCDERYKSIVHRTARIDHRVSLTAICIGRFDAAIDGVYLRPHSGTSAAMRSISSSVRVRS